MPRVVKIEIKEEAEALNELRQGVRKFLKDLNNAMITSVTGWEFIIEALVMTGI
jgi:hypothetical protein